MRSGVKKRVGPHVRNDAPTSSRSRTVVSQPRSIAPSAAANPIGPAPITATRGGIDQSFRATALHACTQCAIVPPPRITAATFTASAISSGLIPLSVHAEAYESMQYGS
jgi:hypothetical protein